MKVNLDEFTQENHEELIEKKIYKKPGPMKKAIEDKANKKILLSLLSSEMENLKKKAGDVPLATYIKKILKTQGVI